MRTTLLRLRADAARVPQLAGLERALADALAEIDELENEQKSQLRLSAHGPVNAMWHRGLR